MILRTGNNHSSSHSLSPKWMKNNKGGIKDERKLRDDSGIVDIDKRSGVGIQDGMQHVQLIVEGVIHSFNNY